MKRFVAVLGALAFVLGAGGALSQMPAHADEAKAEDEAKVEEAYTPPKEELEINDIEEEQNSAARAINKKNMKAKMRRLRRGNHSAPGRHGASNCSSAYCR